MFNAGARDAHQVYTDPRRLDIVHIYAVFPAILSVPYHMLCGYRL